MYHYIFEYVSIPLKILKIFGIYKFFIYYLIFKSLFIECINTAIFLKIYNFFLLKISNNLNVVKKS